MNGINEAQARRVLELVDQGLTSGLGEPKPGGMCIMACINYAMGHEHGDKPSCVHPVVRAFDIRLNDSRWSSNEARAKGMRREAIAKLGSTNIDGDKFAELVAIGTVARVLPAMLEVVAKRFPEHAEALDAARVACEGVTTRGAAEAAARNAEAVCRKVRADAYAAAYAAAAADAAAYAAAAADAAADAAAAAYAAADAAAAAYAAAYAAADAAAAAYAAAAAAADAAADRILCISADIACEALVACGSEGAAWLFLCDESQP